MRITNRLLISIVNKAIVNIIPDDIVVCGDVVAPRRGGALPYFLREFHRKRYLLFPTVGLVESKKKR